MTEPLVAPFPDRCNLVAGEYIHESYSSSPIDGDIVFAPPDIDAELAEMETRLLRQVQMFSHDPTKPYVNKNGPKIRIGFDSEFTYNSETGENNVLSVQFYVVGDDGEFQTMIYPNDVKKSSRPSFSRTLLSLVLDGMENGQISEWPSGVIFAGFFVRLDLAAFSDLDDFKNELDSAGGKLTTIGKGIDFTFDQSGHSLPRKRSMVVRDCAGLFLVPTTFIDLGRHVVEGTTLEKIGSWLGLPKLELQEGFTKDRMDLLLRDNKVAFDEYAMRDAEITVRFLEHLEKFALAEVGCNALPATVSSLAVQLLKNELKSAGIDFHDNWGLVEEETEVWNNRTGKVSRKTDIVPNATRKSKDPLVVLSYHGGRNESFMCGPTDVGNLYDFDVAGAYTTGLADLRQIDYAGFWHTSDPLDFVGHVLGFALVKFKFPADRRFPSLPVEMGVKGLYFPLSGTSYCTAPEIEVSLKQGCEMTILDGIVFPWKGDDTRIFEGFVKKVRTLRARFKKDRTDPNVATLPEEYAKLAGNSAYGKLAQGLKDKTVFSPRGMQNVKLPHSAITNAIMASHATGFVRAVMAQLLIGVPTECTVVSVTTDGFLTNASLDQIDTEGSMVTRFKALCERVAPGSAMLECKHRVRQLISAKTRCQITVIPFLDADGNPTPVVLAKGSVSPSVPKAEHNAYMLDLYLNRQPGQKTTSRPFTSMSKQFKNGVDVTRMERSSLLNLEFDFKREPFNPRMVEVAGRSHLALDTRPWACPEMGASARAYFDGWRLRNRLADLDDWANWQAHHQFSSARGRLASSTGNGAKRGINMTKEGPVGLMKRTFLRAFVRSTWGVTLADEKMSHQEVANWLTSLGHSTKKSAVSNSIREDLVEMVVPSTPEVLAFIDAIRTRFPNIEIERFLISPDSSA